jgi:hypothetical protein
MNPAASTASWKAATYRSGNWPSPPFTQARKKLKFEAFVELNGQAPPTFYADAPVKRWHGHRRLAVEGTTLRLPNTPETRKAFAAKAGEVPLGRLPGPYGVCHDLVIGAEFPAMEIGEGFHAGLLLDRASPGGLVLYGRGYPSFYLMPLHRKAGIGYCMRTPVGLFKAVAGFVAKGRLGQWVGITPSHKAKRDCLRNGVPVDPIRVRLVRVELPGGEVGVLMASLGDGIPHGEFAAPYFQRWGIEGGYKLQKCRAGLENFSGKTVHSVYQDIYAKLPTANLVSPCAFGAEGQAQQVVGHRRRGYQANRAKAPSKAKYHLVCTVLDMQDRLERLLGWIAADVGAVRPGRKFERIKPGKKKQGHHPAYKPTA